MRREFIKSSLRSWVRALRESTDLGVSDRFDRILNFAGNFRADWVEKGWLSSSRSLDWIEEEWKGI